MKFLLIDSNIAGSGGHYLEYAEQILEVMSKRGYECHVAANKAFHQARKDVFYKSHSVFDFDMWGRNLSRGDSNASKFTDGDRTALKHYYSVAGLLWAAAGSLESTRHYSQQTTLPIRLAKRLAQVHALRTSVEQLLAASNDTGGGANGEATRWHYDRFRVALRAASSTPTKAQPDNSALADMLRASRAADNYEAAIAGLLSDLSFGPDDHVFIPTLSLSEARAVRDLLQHREAARAPQWSLLFRRDVFPGYSGEWPKHEWAAHEARNLFASFLAVMDNVRVAFFTDTDMLTKQYRRLASVPFRTTAIPVRSTEPLRCELAASAPVRVLVVIENSHLAGLKALADLLESLPASMLERVQFVVPTSPLSASDEPEAEVEKVLDEQARQRPYLGDVVIRVDGSLGLAALGRTANVCLAIEPVGGLGTRLSVELLALEALGLRIEIARPAATTGRETGATYDLSAALWRLIDHWQPSLTPDHQVMLGYLGDARAEKGFHLLPDIFEGLNRGSGGMQKSFALNAQVYHPNPESDVRMLTAMERLRHMPTSEAYLEEGALDSEAYQAIIARSDIVYNIYARHNYISRSSGIFVEALASKKPVLTTGGTWMSGLMAEWSQPYHDEVLKHCECLDARVLKMHNDWSFIGDVSAVKADNQLLQLVSGLSAVQSGHIPDRASHFRFEICTKSANPDAPLCLIVAWQDDSGLTFREVKRDINRSTPGQISLVFPVPDNAKQLWLGLSLSHFLQECTIESVKVSWYHSNHAIAEVPGGIAIRDGVDAEMTQSCISAAAEIGAALPAYNHSCGWIFQHWAGKQTATQLVDDLLAPAPIVGRAPQRFAGREW